MNRITAACPSICNNVKCGILFMRIAKPTTYRQIYYLTGLRRDFHHHDMKVGEIDCHDFALALRKNGQVFFNMSECGQFVKGFDINSRVVQDIAPDEMVQVIKRLPDSERVTNFISYMTFTGYMAVLFVLLLTFVLAFVA